MSTELLAPERSHLESCEPVARACDTVEWLVDNAAAYQAFIDAIRGATRSIRLSQLAFDADCVAYASDGAAIRLLDALVDAHRERGVDVRILLNESLLLDTATPLRRVLATMGASSIVVRGVSRFPQLLHAKLMVVDDGDAYLIGSPFANGYWDDSTHHPIDVRRPTRELGGRPLHDVSVRVAGQPATALAEHFDELWSNAKQASDDECDALEVEPRASDPSVRIVRTSPIRARHGCAAGDTEILDAMLDGIGRAERLLYIEHQYMSSRIVIDAIVAALARAPELEVIALLNQNPDVTAYRGWQNARFRESGLQAHPRVGLFALWSRDAGAHARIGVNQVFVHSKVIIVDDAWATVGSANVDGVSLHSYGSDFESRLGERVFRDVRNFDLNLVIESGDDDSAPPACIAALRDALLYGRMKLRA